MPFVSSPQKMFTSILRALTFNEVRIGSYPKWKLLFPIYAAGPFILYLLYSCVFQWSSKFNSYQEYLKKLNLEELNQNKFDSLVNISISSIETIYYLVILLIFILTAFVANISLLMWQAKRSHNINAPESKS